MRWFVRLLVVAVVYGAVSSCLPSPTVVGVFWVSNLSTPYLLFPFLAGITAGSWRAAVLRGVLSDWAILLAFYAHGLVGPAAMANARRMNMRYVPGQGRKLGPAITVAGVEHWLRLMLTSEWMLLSLPAGLVFGALGYWWRHSSSRIAAVALALPFLGEPVAWRVFNGQWYGPSLIWASEALAGLLILAILLALTRRMAPAQPQLSSP